MHMALSALLNLVKCKICLLPLVLAFYCSLGWISINNWEPDQRPIFKTVYKCLCSLEEIIVHVGGQDLVWTNDTCKACFKIHHVLVAFFPHPKGAEPQSLAEPNEIFRLLAHLEATLIHDYRAKWEAMRSVLKLLQPLVNRGMWLLVSVSCPAGCPSRFVSSGDTAEPQSCHCLLWRRDFTPKEGNVHSVCAVTLSADPYLHSEFLRCCLHVWH